MLLALQLGLVSELSMAVLAPGEDGTGVDDDERVSVGASDSGNHGFLQLSQLQLHVKILLIIVVFLVDYLVGRVQSLL